MPKKHGVLRTLRSLLQRPFSEDQKAGRGLRNLAKPRAPNRHEMGIPFPFGRRLAVAGIARQPASRSRCVSRRWQRLHLSVHRNVNVLGNPFAGRRPVGDFVWLWYFASPAGPASPPSSPADPAQPAGIEHAREGVRRGVGQSISSGMTAATVMVVALLRRHPHGMSPGTEAVAMASSRARHHAALRVSTTGSGSRRFVAPALATDRRAIAWRP